MFPDFSTFKLPTIPGFTPPPTPGTQLPGSSSTILPTERLPGQAPPVDTAAPSKVPLILGAGAVVLLLVLIMKRK